MMVHFKRLLTLSILILPLVIGFTLGWVLISLKIGYAMAQTAQENMLRWCKLEDPR